METIRDLFQLIDKRTKVWLIALGITRYLIQLIDIAMLLGVAVFVSLLAGFQAKSSAVEVWVYSSLGTAIDAFGYPIVASGLGLMIAIRLSATLGHALIVSRFVGQLEGKLSKRLIRKHIRNDASKTGDDTSSSQLQNTILNSTTAVSKGYTALIGLFSDSSFLVSLFITTALVDWRLALSFLAAGSILGWLLFQIITKRVKHANKLSIKASGDFLQEFKDVTRIRTELELHGKTDFWLDRVSSPRGSSARNIQHALFLNQVPRITLESLLLVSILISAALASGDVFGAPVVEPATLTIVLLLGLRFVGALSPILSLFNQFAEVRGRGYLALNALLTERREAPKDPLTRLSDQVTIEHPVGITLSKLTFRYAGATPILKDVSLNIRPGEIVAITGTSGRGKSTLLDILAGRLVPIKGNLEFKDPSGNELARGAIRLGYVPQFPHIFNGSVAENIVLGDYRDDLEARVRSAAVLAGLKIGRDIPSIHSHVDSEISMLSGGQAQRIGLARALFNSPNLLLLDEPTSALDHETMTEVMSRIFSLRGQVTVVMITHNVSLLGSFDKHFEL